MGISISELKNLINTEIGNKLNSFTSDITANVSEQIKKILVQPGINKLAGGWPGDSDSEPKQSVGFKKSYKDIFNIKGSLSKGPFTDFDDCLNAIRNKYDSRLKTLVTSEGSGAGFLLPEAFEQALIDSAMEQSIIRSRAKVYSLSKEKGNTLRIPAWQDTNHSTAGIRGITPVYKAENTELSETDPIFREVELKLNKLTAFTKTSAELLEDSGIPISSVVGPALIEAISFKEDDRYFNGGGAGQPLGVLNSPCLITVDPEVGQASTEIVYENIVNIFAKLLPGCYKNACWCASISLIPTMMQLNQKIGVSGERIPILKEIGGQFTLLGIPLFFTEKLPLIGTAGAIGLYDFSFYGILMKQGVNLQASDQAEFSKDLTQWKATFRHDGQGLLNKPVTLLDGVSTASCFVVLGDF